MNKIFITIIITIFVSCINNDEIKVKITNESQYDIKNIQFSTQNSSINLIELKIGKNYNNFLNMKNIKKIDGSYQLNYKINNEIRSINTGYYTNGIPLDNKVEIIINNDTVFIRYDN